MSYTITRTKVILPRRPRDLVQRQRLLNMLDDLLDYRLALIAAPAGYGKTTLLVDFAGQVKYPVCWLALDSLDNDLLRFITYFIAAIHQCFPEFGGPSRSLVSNLGSGEIDQERVLRTVINDLYEHVSEHFALVLDDFHLIDHNPEINHFINRFAQEVDENCHLVIASRSLLSLPDLPLMIGRSQVKGLSFEELAFHPDEIQALYQIKYHQEMSPRDADTIARETEGWITGLLLTAETTREGSSSQGQAARAAGVDLYDYLASQVLDKQSPEMQDFMLRSSLLGEFNAALCQETLGDPPGGKSWEGLIGELLQKNLFIQPVDDGGTWTRYHHLFSDFLRQRFQRTDPEGARKLLTTLIEAFTRRGWWEKAYAACQQLGEEEVTAKYIETASAELIHSGRISLLNSWLKKLPPSEIEDNPTLLAQHGVVTSISGDPTAGIIILNRAINLINPENNPDLYALILIRRATSQRFLGNFNDGLKDALNALDIAHKAKQGKVLIAESEREIGLNKIRLGNNKEAKKHLAKSLSEYIKQKDPRNAAFLEMDQGFLAMNEGGYPEAREYFRQAYQLWEEQGNLNQLVGLCNNLGVLDHLSGEYREAFDWFSQALEFARQTSSTRNKAFTLASLADLALDLAALPQAESYLSQAGALADETGETFLQSYLALSRARLSRKSGRLEMAKFNLDAVQPFIRDNPHGIASGKFHLEQGRIWLEENQHKLALAELEAAGEVFSQANQPVENALALIFLARLHLLQGEEPTAREKLEKAGQIVADLGTHAPLVSLLADQEEYLEELAALFPPDHYLHSLARAVREFQSRLPGLKRALGFTDLPGYADLAPFLEIQGLGRELVKCQGERIEAPEWNKQKTVRELFFFLLSQPEGSSREEICRVFWPDSDPELLKKQFKNALYRLRRALGKDAILFHPPTRLYHFNRELDYRYDVEEFRAAALQGEGESDPERKIHSLRQAVDIYQHPFAPTLDGIWAEPERFRLYTRFENSLLALASLLYEREDFRGCLAASSRLLEIAPGQEQACRLAMRCHAAQGNRAGVRQVYQDCRRALDRDLDTAPSPETFSLYNSLMG